MPLPSIEMRRRLTVHATEPLRLEHWLPHTGVVFVQIGANRGNSSGDKIWPFASQPELEWRGAVLEPNPVVFEQLSENYASVPQF